MIAGLGLGRVLLVPVAAAALVGAAAPPPTATPTPSPNAMWLTSEPPGTVHYLTPGETTVWDVDVATAGAGLDTLTGALSVAGPLAASGAVAIEILSCTRPWSASDCPGGEHVVLAPTAASALATGPWNLQDAKIPRTGITHVQIRVTLRQQDIATLDRTARLTFTADAGGGAAPSGSSAARLADTGTRVADYGLLAAAAVLFGIALARLGRLRRRRHD